MRKWKWLLPAVALWTLPAAQAQLMLGPGPRYGPPGRYDVQNPPLAAPLGASPTLRGIYADAAIATAPWQDRRPQVVPILQPGPLSPCRLPDPMDLHISWDPRPDGPNGINPLERRMDDILDRKRSGHPDPNPSAGIPPEVRERLPIPQRVGPVPSPRPAPQPGVAPSPAPFWPNWGWVAVGVFVLGLLALLLRAYVERKRAAG